MEQLLVLSPCQLTSEISRDLPLSHQSVDTIVSHVNGRAAFIPSCFFSRGGPLAPLRSLAPPPVVPQTLYLGTVLAFLVGHCYPSTAPPLGYSDHFWTDLPPHTTLSAPLAGPTYSPVLWSAPSTTKPQAPHSIPTS